MPIAFPAVVLPNAEFVLVVLMMYAAGAHLVVAFLALAAAGRFEPAVRLVCSSESLFASLRDLFGCSSYCSGRRRRCIALCDAITLVAIYEVL